MICYLLYCEFSYVDLCDNQCRVFGILSLFELSLARWHSGELYLAVLFQVLHIFYLFI